jgi:hypothetical protein
MKYAVVAAIALVVGLVLGTVPFQGRLSSMQTALDNAKAQECKPRVGQELATMFAGGRLSGMGQDGEPSPPAEAGEEMDADRETTSEDAGSRRRGFQIGGEDIEWTDDEERNMGLAKEALELRRTQARAALMEDAAPDEDQLAFMDEALDQMNRELEVLAEDLIAEVNESGGEPSRRDMMGFAADALDIFITAEDAITDSLDDDQLASVEDGSLDPFSYVDPELIDLFAELDR